MTNEQKQTDYVLALERHLEIYGADQTRWPQEARERFAPLLEHHAGARVMLAEARALDRLLDCAPPPGIGRERALRDRIVAAVSNDCVGGRGGQPAARVIELSPTWQRSRTAFAPPGTVWRTALLLAASLVLGVYLGAGGGLTPAVEVVAETVGLETQVEPYQLSLVDDDVPLAEEDML
jgi:hypothetical protein